MLDLSFLVFRSAVFYTISFVHTTRECILIVSYWRVASIDGMIVVIDVDVFGVWCECIIACIHVWFEFMHAAYLTLRNLNYISKNV